MKRFHLRVRRLFCLLVLAWPAWARAQYEPPLIHKISIQHIGPPAVSDSFILANIRSKEGERLFTATVEEDESSLYNTGYFFTVRVNSTNTPDGVDLIYVVEGKPIVTDIRIIGNKKLTLNKLKKKLSSKTGQPLDELKLFHDSQAMQELYQKAGYQDTTVEVKPPSIDELNGRATVTIEIHETPKIRLVDVVFEGASAFPQKKLRHVFKTTRRHWMFSWLTGSGVLKKDDFQADQDLLIEFYQNDGYIDFAIQDIKYEYPAPNRMIIRVVVSEGRQYKVGNLDISGNKIFSTNTFIKGTNIDGKLMKLTCVPGAIFKPTGFDDDIETLRDIYGAKGYLTRDQNGTTAISASRNPNAANGTMDVAYHIDEGEKCYIERIEIKGNEKTKDRVVRRELAVYPGEVYDMVRVKISKQRLENMEYFSKVDTQAEDTDVPNRKNLEIGLEEKSMSSASVGAGFSSEESIVGFAEVKMGNFDLFNPPTFTGAGQKLQLIASLGSLYQDYEVSFTEPYFLGKKLALGVSFFHKEVDYDSMNYMYDETYNGGTISLTKSLNRSQTLSGGISYTLEAVDVSINSGFTTNSTTNLTGVPGGLYSVPTVTGPNISTNIYDEHGSTLINKFGLNLSYDTRRTVQDNDRGQHSQILAQVATAPGDTDFYKLELRTSWYFRGFRPGDIIELDGRAGVADTYGDTARVPIFERWFLGGLNSLRGFKYRQVGPADQFGEPLGGDTYWFGGAEYSIPIVTKIIRLAWFYDAGDVYADPYSFKLSEQQSHYYNDDAGMGLRILLPVGGGMPLRLDYGIPITHDINSGSAGKVQVSVGFSRDF
jgi:outer membrane protein insertion porin family